jgi:molybdopterin molybdotransferase
MVTAQLFLRPLIAALTGAMPDQPHTQRAFTLHDIPAASAREEYLRAVVSLGDDGSSTVRAAENQDSSLLSPFLVANCLIRRPIKAPAAKAGDLVEILMLR